MKNKYLMCFVLSACMTFTGACFAAESNAVSVPANEISEGSSKEPASDLSDKLSELVNASDEENVELINEVSSGEISYGESMGMDELDDHPEPPPVNETVDGVSPVDGVTAYGYSESHSTSSDGLNFGIGSGISEGFNYSVGASSSNAEGPSYAAGSSVNTPSQESSESPATSEGQSNSYSESDLYPAYDHPEPAPKDAEESEHSNDENPFSELNRKYFMINCPNCGAEINLWNALNEHFSEIESTEITRQISGIDPEKLEPFHKGEDKSPVENTEETDPVASTTYYEDDSCKITTFTETYNNTRCVASHIELSDYARLNTDDASSSDFESLYDAADRLKALLLVGGDFEMPSEDTICVRNSHVVQDGTIMPSTVYSDKTGLFTLGEDDSLKDDIEVLVKEGKVSDTLTFFPAFLKNGGIMETSSADRQRKVILGSSEKPGDFWLVICDGGVDGQGLTFNECASYLKEKGCTLGFQLTSGRDANVWMDGRMLDEKGIEDGREGHFLYIQSN